MPKQPLLPLFLCLTLLGSGATSGWAQVPANIPSQLQPGILQQENHYVNQAHTPKAISVTFSDGVFQYRQGHHQQALGIFERLHQTDPHNTKLTYYLAITHTQLGNANQARSFYLQTLALAPSYTGPANEGKKLAQLARQGLQNLPPVDTSTLDTPPALNALNAQATTSHPAYIGPQQPTHQPTQQTSPQTQQASQQYGMSQQDMAMLQMMMNGQNNGGMNPLMMMGGMMPGQGTPNNTGQNGQNTHNLYGQMDPSIMSNMMMNQMLQNFSFGVDKKDR